MSVATVHASFARQLRAEGVLPGQVFADEDHRLADVFGVTE